MLHIVRAQWARRPKQTRQPLDLLHLLRLLAVYVVQYTRRQLTQGYRRRDTQLGLALKTADKLRRARS